MKTRPALAPWIIAIAFHLLFLACPAHSAVREFLNFQGRVSVNGVPFTGTGLFRFALIDPNGPVPAVDLGAPSAPSDTPVSIPVSKGLYVVRIGLDTVSPPEGYFDHALEPHLRVWFDDGAHGLQQLRPDQPMASVPYARHSQTAAVAQVAARALAAEALTAPLPADRLSGTLDPALVPLQLPGDRSFADRLGIGAEPDPSVRLHVAGDVAVAGTVTATEFRGRGIVSWTSVTDASVQTVANQGYLAAHEEGVTLFTLPATAEVGDVIQISGIGKGRWRVRNAAGSTVLGDGYDARWTRLATDTNRNWTAVASSADGTRLVACEDGYFFGNSHPGSRGGFVHTSSDSGATWLQRRTDFPHSWISVASSADGLRLVGVSYGTGTLQTSDNGGETWTPRSTNPRVTWWHSVASSADGQRLVAVDAGGFIHTSADGGASWVARATEATRTWQGVASSADGQRLVAGGMEGLFTSSDAGQSWTRCTLDSTLLWTSVACSADGLRLVAGSRTGLFTSDDAGQTWIRRLADKSRFWSSVASSADGTELVAAERQGHIFISTDSGETWTAHMAESVRLWASVAFSADGTRVFAAENGGYLYASDFHGGARGVLARFQFSASGEWASASTPALDASGVFELNTIPELPASKIARGTLDLARIPALPASRITSGQLDPERLPFHITWGRSFEGPIIIGPQNTFDAMLSVAGDLAVTGEITARSIRGAGTLAWKSVAESEVNLLPNQGCLAARDDGLTTFTLPATAEVGDVIRIVGTGTGGWWVRKPDGNLLLGGPAGLTWTARATDERRPWWGIASSADGRQLVAASLGGYLYTSADAGASWTPRATDLPRYWGAVACSADGARLLAAERPGHLHSSLDTGRSWNARATDAMRPWYFLASSADGNRLVAVEEFGDLLTSANTGVSWSVRPTGAKRAWRSVASSANGLRLVAAEAGGFLHLSSDGGASWTASATDAPRAWNSVACSSDGQRVVASEQGGSLYVSTDAGASWSPCLNDVGRAWVGVASSADGVHLVAAAYNEYLHVSTNAGLTWTPRATDSPRPWKAVACAADGQRLLAAESNGYLYTSESRAGRRGDSAEFFRAASGEWIPVSTAALSVSGVTPPASASALATSRFAADREPSPDQGLEGALADLRGSLRAQLAEKDSELRALRGQLQRIEDLLHAVLGSPAPE